VFYLDPATGILSGIITATVQPLLTRQHLLQVPVIQAADVDAQSHAECIALHISLTRRLIDRHPAARLTEGLVLYLHAVLQAGQALVDTRLLHQLTGRAGRSPDG